MFVQTSGSVCQSPASEIYFLEPPIALSHEIHATWTGLTPSGRIIVYLGVMLFVKGWDIVIWDDASPKTVGVVSLASLAWQCDFHFLSSLHAQVTDSNEHVNRVLNNLVTPTLLFKARGSSGKSKLSRRSIKPVIESAF